MPDSHYSKLDHWIMTFDRQILATLSGNSRGKRPYPAENHPEIQMSEHARRTIEGYMRVNYAGEVSAQALYLGQALTARDKQLKHAMEESAEEERDHLDWCQRRLRELKGRTSYLDPVWFVGSFTIGALAGIVGDKWSLGFIEETEEQVISHLQSHLDNMPVQDHKTTAVLQQMKTDETHHRDKATNYGAAPLPKPVKRIMNWTSKIMTKSAFWI